MLFAPLSLSSLPARLLPSVAALLLCALPLLAHAADDQATYLTAEAGGADFATQGEYLGRDAAHPVGVQVIALGEGKFEAVVYPGGLPGEGGDFAARRKVAVGNAAPAKTEEAVVLGAAGDVSLHHKGAKLALEKVERKSSTLGKPAPAGAVVLFDGSNVDAWEPGKLEDGKLMGVGTRTKEKFGDFTLHLEFRTPFMPQARGQARGNSGLYLGDQYETQVLDSFGLDGADNECGGIYQNARPLVNMCYPPLSWQTYDVEFTVAKFDAAGKVTAPARVTVHHNGVLIHDNIELRPTPGGGQNDQKPGSLYLQDHGNPVRFQNIWVVKH